MSFAHPVRLRARPVPLRLAVAVLLLSGTTACVLGSEGGRKGEADGRTEGTLRANPPEIEGLPELTWHLLEEASWIDDAVWLGEEWVVLDGFQGRLHRLGEDGGPSTGAGFAAGSGQGPGELGAPRLLAGDGRGVWVVGMGGRLDRFDREGGFIGRTRLPSTASCPSPEPHDAAAREGALLLSVGCRSPGGQEVHLLRVDAPGEPVELRVNRIAGPRAISLQRGTLTVRGERILHGSGGHRCLERIHLQEAEAPPDTSGFCVRGAARPLPSSVRRELDGALGARVRSAGMRMELPELLPWYDQLFLADESVVARRPGSGDGWSLERMGAEPAGWVAPAGVEPFGDRGRLLLVALLAEGPVVASLLVDDLPWTPLPPQDGG